MTTSMTIHFSVEIIQPSLLRGSTVTATYACHMNFADVISSHLSIHTRSTLHTTSMDVEYFSNLSIFPRSMAPETRLPPRSRLFMRHDPGGLDDKTVVVYLSIVSLFLGTLSGRENHHEAIW